MSVLKYKDPITGEIKTVGYIATPAEPVYAPTVMSVSNWVGNKYSFESAYPYSSYSIQVESLATTAEEFEAYGSAMMVGSADTNIITALGDVPTIDLPIKLTITPKNANEVDMDYVMEASKWEDNFYSFEDLYPHASYVVSVEVSDKANAEQFEEFGNAMITGSTDSNVAKALGDVPMSDIPVMLKVVAR